MKTVAFPLLGRSAELDRLSDALAATKAGTGGLVVIEGEAGIGKSRVLEELVRRALGSGFVVFTGAAQELEAERPFGLIRDALLSGARQRVPAAAELAELSRLLRMSSAARLDPAAHAPEARFQVVDAVTELIEKVAASGPLL